MGVFFNGRLWVSPVTASLVDDSEMYNRNLSVGNVLALAGRAEGGVPFVPLRFGSPQEARAVLRSGEMLKAVEKAFDPSAQTGGPMEVICFRVGGHADNHTGQPTEVTAQSASVIKGDGAVDLIDLVSTDYGTYTNQIKYKIETASISGKKLTTQFGNSYFSQDNVYRNAFSVFYVGAEATATVTISGTQVILKSPAATTVATLELTSYGTVQSLVDAIGVVSGFSASVLDGNGETATLQGLDFVAAQSVKTTLDGSNLPLVSYTATANLQAVVDWFNGQGEGYVTATRKANVGIPVANVAFTYLTGGTDGVTVTADWQSVFDAIQNEDVQWVVPISSTPAIHAMADTHVSYMSNVARMERRCIVGGAVGATDDAAIAAAKTFNNDRTSYTHLGFYDYNAAGVLRLFPPYILAAQIAGAFSGVNPGTALTNKALKIKGLERKLRNPVDTDRLILGGVLCVEDTKKGFKVVQSISTWLINDNYNRVEVSTGVACDFTMRNWRNAVDDLRGSKANPQLLMLAVEKTESCLRELARPEPMGPGVLVGDAENPPYKNITASIEGDVLRIECQASPVIPCNYILLVMHAVPWSGTYTQK
jgi:hypothetical protein